MAAPRTHEVDVIRLIALFGIFIVNLPVMGIFEDSLAEASMASHDQYAKLFIALLFEGKFILLFSFIFGWGIAIQQQKFTETGRNFTAYYFRRAFGLILLGVFHMAFIFGGDILVIYGILSILFWFLRDFALRSSTRRFITIMLSLNFLTAILSVIAIVVLYLATNEEEFLTLNNQGLGGSFYEATQYRLKEGGTILLMLIVFAFHLLAAFGLGYSAQNAGFFEPNSESFAKLRQALPKLLIIGILCNALYAFAISELIDELWLLPGILLWFIGAPALSAFYLYFIITIARRINIPEILIFAGRNSLSVYVLQGLIASLIFGGYGLGWFDKFGELALIPVAIGIYLATVLIVGLYAQKFGRGFLEPILRRISGS